MNTPPRGRAIRTTPKRYQLRLSDFLEVCDAISDGALDDLNAESRNLVATVMHRAIRRVLTLEAAVAIFLKIQNDKMNIKFIKNNYKQFAMTVTCF